MDVLAPICRAIHAKRPVAIRYHSMSSGESERVIVPFALVDTGLRWHVRAFDRKSGEFRDFVVTRIEAPTLLDEEPQANERPDNDIQWTRIVELDFVPHPRLERPEIIKMAPVKLFWTICSSLILLLLQIGTGLVTLKVDFL